MKTPSILALFAIAIVGQLASADFVEIDNLGDGTLTSINTLTSGSITVSRTITNIGGPVQFSHSGNQFGVVDNPSAGAPPIIGTFTYTASGGTFQDLLRANTSFDPAKVFASGFTFNYTVFNFDTNNTPDYSVRIFADGAEVAFDTLDASKNTYIFEQQGSPVFDVNEIKLTFERNTSAGGGFFAIQNNMTVTPEPASALLFGTVALGFVARRRRR